MSRRGQKCQGTKAFSLISISTPLQFYGLVFWVVNVSAPPVLVFAIPPETHRAFLIGVAGFDLLVVAVVTAFAWFSPAKLTMAGPD